MVDKICLIVSAVSNFLKLNCHFLFMHAENSFVLRTKDIYIQAVQANTRFISLNQCKNALHEISYSKLKSLQQKMSLNFQTFEKGQGGRHTVTTS